MAIPGVITQPYLKGPHFTSFMLCMQIDWKDSMCDFLLCYYDSTYNIFVFSILMMHDWTNNTLTPNTTNNGNIANEDVK